MTQLEIAAHRGAAQVEVAEFHAEVVAAVGVILDGERRHLRGVEHRERVGYNLYVAGGEVGVLARALGNGAGDLYHEFASEVVGGVVQGRRLLHC